MRRAATILALTAVFLVGVGAAIAIVNDTNASLWATLEQSSMWKTYSKQNPAESARVKNYWLNGGAKPTVATKFGTFLVEVNEDRVGTQPPPPPPPTTGTTTTTPPPPPPPPTGFPDASNTGVPAGTSLTAYTGPSNITTANTVITGKTMGCVSVATTGVVIRNSRITCGSGYAAYVDDRFTTQTALTIEDSEISCSDAPGSAGIGEADITARRVEITHCENGLDMNQNITLEDSYVHNLYNGGASHADGAQVALGHWNGSSFVCCGLNLTLRHNTIYGMGDNDTSFGTSAIITTSTDTNVLITGNVLAGGAYTLYCNRPGKGVNFVVTNNRFSQRFKQTVGFYGPVTDCSDETASGNTYLESGLGVPGIG